MSLRDCGAGERGSYYDEEIAGEGETVVLAVYRNERGGCGCGRDLCGVAAFGKSLFPDHSVAAGIIWLLDIYSFLYLLYRLLYLWRGTPKRIRWTVFCLFTIIWNWVPDASAGSPLYLVHGLISIVSMILSIACLVHDYGVITGAVEQYIPERRMARSIPGMAIDIGTGVG